MVFSSTKSWFVKFLPVLLFLLALGVGLTLPVLKSEFPELRKAADFYHFINGKGFYLFSGKESSGLENNFFLADHPLNFEKVCRLNRSNCGQGPHWNGIIWISEITPSPANPLPLDTNSIAGHKRLWGNLLVAGDPELMDRIEQHLRERN